MNDGIGAPSKKGKWDEANGRAETERFLRQWAAPEPMAMPPVRSPGEVEHEPVVKARRLNALEGYRHGPCDINNIEARVQKAPMTEIARRGIAEDDQ